MVARRAHNPEVVGSNPASATKKESIHLWWMLLFFCWVFGLNFSRLAQFVSIAILLLT